MHHWSFNVSKRFFFSKKLFFSFLFRQRYAGIRRRKESSVKWYSLLDSLYVTKANSTNVLSAIEYCSITPLFHVSYDVSCLQFSNKTCVLIDESRTEGNDRVSRACHQRRAPMRACFYQIDVFWPFVKAFSVAERQIVPNIWPSCYWLASDRFTPALSLIINTIILYKYTIITITKKFWRECTYKIKHRIFFCIKMPTWKIMALKMSTYECLTLYDEQKSVSRFSCDFY